MTTQPELHTSNITSKRLYTLIKLKCQVKFKIDPKSNAGFTTINLSIILWDVGKYSIFTFIFLYLVFAALSE